MTHGEMCWTAVIAGCVFINARMAAGILAIRPRKAPMSSLVTVIVIVEAVWLYAAAAGVAAVLCYNNVECDVPSAVFMGLVFAVPLLCLWPFVVVWRFWRR